jgi:hypothetical protein
MAVEDQNHDSKMESGLRDREFEAALAKYAAVEPRAGLEDRILANLQAESRRSPRSVWGIWNIAWVVVGIAAVVAVVAALMLRTNIRQVPEITVLPATEAPSAKQSRPQVATARANHAPAPAPVVAMPAHGVKKRERSTTVAGAFPRLDQFPSPRPLSNEERLLVRYVQKFPEAAVTIARAQTESEIEIERLISNQPPAQDPEPQQYQ